MLSRVRTLKGLFLRDPLKYHGGKHGKDYSVPKELLKMQEAFATSKRPKAFNDQFNEADVFQDSKELQHSFNPTY